MLLLWGKSAPMSWAQRDTLFLNSNLQEKQAIDIRQYANIYADTSHIAKPISALRNADFVPFNNKPVVRKYIKTIDWVKFTMKNTDPQDTLHLLLYCGFQHYIEAYFFQNNIQTAYIKGGHLSEASAAANTPLIDNLSIPIHLLPQQLLTCYVKISNYKQTVKPSIKPEELRIFTYDQYRLLQAQQFRDRKGIILFLSFLVGLCIFLAASALFYFLLNKDRTYLWWALYLSTNVLYFTGRIEVFANFRLVSSVFPKYLVVSAYTITTLSIIFYLLFIAAFFNIKAQNPKLYGWIRYGYVFMFGLFAVLLSFSYHIDTFTDLPPCFFLYCKALFGFLF